MKIGFLSPLIPSVAYGHRPFSFLKHLVSKGHRITLHCIEDPGPVPSAAASLEKLGVDVRPVALARIKRWANCLIGYPGKIPLRVLHCRSRALEEQVIDDLRVGAYDAFHVDRFRLAPYAFRARSVFSGPVILDFPDALSLYYARAVNNPRHWAKGRLDRREHRVIPPYEAEVLRGGLECIVCSEVDRARLRQAVPEATVYVIPNMVDAEEFHPRRRESDRPRLVFTGTLYYLPNIDGLLWFRERILPLLKDLDPVIDVLGYGATAELDPLQADPRFRFHGYVPNMAERLFTEDVFLCPLRIGAGLRFKLLEAFSAGMACVSTTLGFEGIPCVPGEHLLAADAEEEFAAAIRRLFENPEERERIGRRARELVRESYSVEAAGERLEEIYGRRPDRNRRPLQSPL